MTLYVTERRAFLYEFPRRSWELAENILQKELATPKVVAH